MPISAQNIDVLSPQISQIVLILIGKILEKYAPDIERKIQYKQWPEVAVILNMELGTDFPAESPMAVDLIYDLCVAIHSRNVINPQTIYKKSVSP